MSRNPFSLPVDVPDPAGGDVQDFAASLPVPADATLDENALAWVTVATHDDGLAGAWASRWKSGNDHWQQGVATLKVEGDRIFILYRDQGTYLIEGIVKGDRIVGRYINVNHPNDTSPWVGVIANTYRIDGFWSQGRWDLRRCSPDERPEPIVAALLTEARQLGSNELRELLGFARYLRWKAGSGDRP